MYICKHRSNKIWCCVYGIITLVNSSIRAMMIFEYKVFIVSHNYHHLILFRLNKCFFTCERVMFLPKYIHTIVCQISLWQLKFYLIMINVNPSYILTQLNSKYVNKTQMFVKKECYEHSFLNGHTIGK